MSKRPATGSTTPTRSRTHWQARSNAARSDCRIAGSASGDDGSRDHRTRISRHGFDCGRCAHCLARSATTFRACPIGYVPGFSTSSRPKNGRSHLDGGKIVRFEWTSNCWSTGGELAIICIAITLPHCRMAMNDAERIAYHQSGHVAAYLPFCPVSTCCAVQAPGLTSTARVLPHKVYTGQRALIHPSGTTAEAQYLLQPLTALMDPHCHADLRMARDLLRSRAEFDSMLDRVAWIVRRRWTRIGAVGEALLAHQCLRRLTAVFPGGISRNIAFVPPPRIPPIQTSTDRAINTLFSSCLSRGTILLAGIGCC